MRHFGKGLAESVATGRIHHQWLPAELFAEESVSDTIVERLRQRGHGFLMSPKAGVTQAIGLLPDGKLSGVHDPRVRGKTDGF